MICQTMVCGPQLVEFENIHSFHLDWYLDQPCPSLICGDILENQVTTLPTKNEYQILGTHGDL